MIDRIVPEPVGGAHRNPAEAIAALGEAIGEELDALAGAVARARSAPTAGPKYLAIGLMRGRTQRKRRRNLGSAASLSQIADEAIRPPMSSATVLKVVPRLVPMFCMAAMAATAIRAAIRPYSMAVAPFSFLQNLANEVHFRSPVPKLWKSTLPAAPCSICGRTLPI